jgi:hypothetical protein
MNYIKLLESLLFKLSDKGKLNSGIWAWKGLGQLLRDQ